MSKKTTGPKIPGEELKGRELRDYINEFLEKFYGKETPIHLDQVLTLTSYQAAASAIISFVDADFKFSSANSEFSKEFTDILELFGCPFPLRKNDMVQIGVKKMDAMFLRPLYWLTQVITSYAQLANCVTEQLYSEESRMKAHFFSWICHKYSKWFEKGKAYLKTIGSKLQKNFQDDVLIDTSHLQEIEEQISAYSQKIQEMQVPSNINKLNKDVSNLEKQIQDSLYQKEQLKQHLGEINQQIERNQADSNTKSREIENINHEYQEICKIITQQGMKPDQVIQAANDQLIQRKKLEEEKKKYNSYFSQLKNEENEIQNQFVAINNLSEDFNEDISKIKNFLNQNELNLQSSDLSENDIGIFYSNDQMKINQDGNTVSSLFGIDIEAVKNAYINVAQFYHHQKAEDFKRIEREKKQLLMEKERLLQEDAKKQELIQNLEKELKHPTKNTQKKKPKQYSKNDINQLQRKISQLEAEKRKLTSQNSKDIDSQKRQFISFQGKVEQNLKNLTTQLYDLLGNIDVKN